MHASSTPAATTPLPFPCGVAALSSLKVRQRHQVDNKKNHNMMKMLFGLGSLYLKILLQSATSAMIASERPVNGCLTAAVAVV